MSFLKNFGHNVVPIFGGLIPFNIYDADSIKEVQGITLKNVNVSLIIENEKVLEEFGEILFTHFGISGPTVLRISSKLYNLVSKKYKIKGQKYGLIINLQKLFYRKTLFTCPFVQFSAGKYR